MCRLAAHLTSAAHIAVKENATPARAQILLFCFSNSIDAFVMHAVYAMQVGSTSRALSSQYSHGSSSQCLCSCPAAAAAAAGS